MTLSIPIRKNVTEHNDNHHQYAVAYAVCRIFNVTLNVSIVSVFFVLLNVIMLSGVIFAYCPLLSVTFLSVYHEMI
jgi:hypothetical protein